MAEAEDVITDAARHATVFARDLWRRHVRPAKTDMPAVPGLAAFAQRLDLLIAAAFGEGVPIRVAEPVLPPTLLRRLLDRDARDEARALGKRPAALPATDGRSIWLPPRLEAPDESAALGAYRVMALQQAVRARRGSAQALAAAEAAHAAFKDALVRDLYLLCEVAASDAALLDALPGMAAPLDAARAQALACRPGAGQAAAQRPIERLWRALLATPARARAAEVGGCATPVESLARAQDLARALRAGDGRDGHNGRNRGPGLIKDHYSGVLLPPGPERTTVTAPAAGADEADDAASARPPRSARLEHRPKVREPDPGEDDERQGAWMVQTSDPHEHAEDPIGMQRPTDRDESTAAEEFADSLSELPEARLVSTPGRPKEVLLSDDPPEARAHAEPAAAEAVDAEFAYPEWDWRAGAYRDPGAVVRTLHPVEGSQAWVDEAIERQRAALDGIRRQFEMLKARRVRHRKQLDGDDIDLEAFIDAQADFRAGRPLSQAVYQHWRSARRDLSIALLIDVSGSTDSWVSAQQRVIDVEKEALLMVCVALEALAEPYMVQAFSGEGPAGVTVHPVKGFAERWDGAVARRIAALEPERYTRAGAAIRHATAQLMGTSARHRLLVLLSDGKPNDIDDYEGRYGVEDMRQAVTEAKLQGIHPFCLTVDRHAANWLPQVFGAHQYALLNRPERLPAALLDWMRRLVGAIG